MKKFKSFTGFVLAFALLISCCFGVNAAEIEKDDVYAPEDYNIEIAIPEGSFVFKTGNASNLPEWELAGVKNPSEVLMICKEIGATFMITGNGGDTVVYGSKTVSDLSKEYQDFDTLDSETFNEFLTNSTYTDDSTTTVATEYQTPDQKYIYIETKYIDALGDEIYEISCITFIDGFGLAFSHNSTEEITQDSKDFLKDLVYNVKYVEPQGLTAEDIQINQLIFILVVSSLIILAVIVFVVFSIVKGRKKKKESKNIADRLSDYRLYNNKNNFKAEDAYFSNTTEVKDAVLKTFSVYHSYFNKMRSVPSIVFIVLAVLAFILLLVTETDWWMLGVMAASILYCLYKFVTSSAVLEKQLKKFYANKSSRTAKYNFYSNEFTVMGVGNGELHPYFQITQIREYKGYYYIFIGEDNCYILQKSGFTKGRQQEFRDYMMRKTGKKM